MGIEQIQKIHEFGEINVIISLLLCAMLVIALFQLTASRRG